MKPLALLLAFALVTSVAARAEETDAERNQRWQDLHHAILGDRPVKDGAGIITLDAPYRAMDAALVPIGITLGGAKKVKTLYVVIDENPSPLAGTFHFGPAADTHLLKMRVRVDAYTFMHAVAETEDGQLYVASKFVKAAGGCSAPATGDAKLALERLGQMKLKPAADGPAGVDEVQLLVSHPNFNGMQMDQVTRNYTPARFIQTIKVTAGGQLVFNLDSDISLSEDPAITFGVVPQGAAPIDVDMQDSSGAHFQRSFDLPAKGA